MSNPHRFEYTEDMDNKIKELVLKHGKKWSKISDCLCNVVTEDAVRNRYKRLSGVAFRPCEKTHHSVRPCRHFWTAEEDERLVYAVQVNGTNWRKIREHEFPYKSIQAIRNRARRVGLTLFQVIASLIPPEF